MDEEYVLASWVVGRLGRGTVEFFGDYVIRLSGLNGGADLLWNEIRSEAGVSERRLSAVLGGHTARKVLRTLVSQHVLVPRYDIPGGQPPWTSQHAGYVEAVSDDPGSALERAAASRVAIVGLGGIGALVLEHLVGMGVQHFALVDGDRVSTSNLNRQYLFRPNDIGARKTVVAESHLRQFGLSSVSISLYVESAAHLIEMLGRFVPSIVICAADRPLNEIDRWCAEAAAALGASFVTGAVGINRGVWGPVVHPGLTPCYQCCVETVSPRSRPGEALTVSFGPVNSAVVGAG